MVMHHDEVLSSLMSRPKKKDTLKFGVSAAKGRLHPSVFGCSAEMNSVCAEIFAGGENAYTAHLRRRPESRVSRISSHVPKAENIGFNRPIQKKDTTYVVSFFGFRGRKARSAPGDQNAWVGETAPSPRFLSLKNFYFKS